MSLAVSGGALVLRGKGAALEPSWLDLIGRHKPALIELLESEVDVAALGSVPPNRIPPHCEAITPDMLPLVTLTQAQIDDLVAGIPGGAPTVQDIYPLSPMQEGILFHHLVASGSDPYVLQTTYAVESRPQLDRLLGALQGVIDRHDVLRSSVHWQGLPQPVQVVRRHVSLPFQELVPEDDGLDARERLQRRFGDRRIDLNNAPPMFAAACRDEANSRWLLLLLCHHVAVDRVAMDLIQREVLAFLAGTAPLLPSPTPYRQHVAQTRRGSSRQEQEAFFRWMLADVEEPTAPFGMVDLQDGGAVGEALVDLPPDLSARLRESAQASGASVASLFHLAWARVLGSLSGKGDVVFGTVLLGRMQGGEDAGRGVGLFVNTLPLRVRLGVRVSDGLKDVHGTLAQLMRHEHAPLTLALRCSGVQPPTPLFSTLLNYRHGASSGKAEPAWNGIEVLASDGRTNYPLILSVDDREEGFALTVQAAADVDAGRVCGYMHEALEQLAKALQGAPDTPVHRIQVLPAAEREQLLVQWNATEADYPRQACLHELFEAQAGRTPDALALDDGRCALSYALLNARANRLAHHLKALGAGPDTRVALCVQRDADMVVGMLGVLKAGAAYVPLDPRYPVQRLAHILADSTPMAVLTQSEVWSELGDALTPSLAGRPVIRLDTESLPAADHNPGHEAGPGHLAYVIYTSGSTGQPKGVAIEHRNAVNFIHWARQSFSAAELSQTLWSTSLNFDLAVYECFAPLAVGGCVHLVGNALELVSRPRAVTLINTVPSALDALLQAQAVPDSVHTVNLAGEPLKQALVQRVFEQTKVRRVCNLYGPSETTTYSTWVSMAREEGFKPHIGKPVANTRVYLLDAQGQPVPQGVIGELYIAGDGVARGYLNQPQLTSERFVADPHGPAGQKMYRTGDLGRTLGDGNIEFLGRNDHQVKIRGFRIELGEIEARLTQCEGVREAVVLAREDSPGDKRLVAYVVGEQADSQVLREQLGAQLPEYMVPQAIVRLDALPLTPNGKVDRKALPAPDGSAYVERGYEAPVGEVEATLARIWAEVLQLERVGRHDNFFELGGHSLLAVSVMERMREAGLVADVRRLFTSPTIATMGASMGDEASDAPVPPNLIPADCRAITPQMLPLVQLSEAQVDRIVASIPGGAANVQDIYPLAPLQEGILFHHLMNSEGDPYLLQAAYGFEQRSMLDAYIDALRQVVKRHDVLRSSVFWEGLSEPVQVVWRHAELAVQEVQADAGVQDVAAWLQERHDPKRHRLDVREAPLIRLTVAQDAKNGRWVLLLMLHHLVGDHAALEAVHEEIESLLQAQAPLAQPRPYREFVARARGSVPRQEHEAFFTQMLADVDEPTVPLGLSDVHGDGTRVEESSQWLDSALAQQLRQGARRLGASAASLFHLAWARVLASLSGRDDVVFGTVLFGRMQGAHGGRGVGLFINTLPLRVKLQGQVGDGVKALHETLAQLMRHEHAPLSLAQRCSGVQPPAPLFSALLNYRHSATRTTDNRPSRGMHMLAMHERTNYPLILSVDDLGEGFALTVQAVAGADAGLVCACMRTALEQLAKALADSPDSPVNELDVLPASERERQLVEWNATETEYPRHAGVHELFEAQAHHSPKTVAVVDLQGEVSY
ncbi:non-ribosomal peptide synthetase, partial [Piscinibacter terrae]|uniref:non-ribosomal peptide synthetase n=1 Tax=Piscinibacter terrae TaxID=2496871 RepID=UPI000F5A5504